MNGSRLPTFGPDIGRYRGFGGEASEAGTIDWSEGQRGWSIDLPAPVSGLPSNLVKGAPGYVQSTQAYTLLDTDLRKYAGGSYIDGSYQLSLNYEVILPDPELATTRFFTPVVFLVEYGSGGITHTVEVDGEQIITVPSDMIRISVKWDTLLAAPADDGATDNRVPAIKVRANVIRSGQMASNRATRTKLLYFAEDAVQLEVPIPPFAKAFRIVYQDPSTITADAWNLLVITDYTATTVWDQMLTAQIAKMAKDACTRLLPTVGDLVVIGRGAGLNERLFLLEFELAFGAR